MLNQSRRYGRPKIIVHERTAGAPKVSFELTVQYHPVHYGGMDVTSAAEEVPILKKPLLFDLDVLRAIFERVYESDELVMKFLLPTTRPTRFVAAKTWSDVWWVHVMPDNEYLMGTNGIRITDTETLIFQFYGPGDVPGSATLPIVEVTLRADDLSKLRQVPRQPFVRPGLVKLQAVLRRVLKLRPYALHWLETYERALCAPGGRGRKRDLEEFEADFGA